jgi:hypothetical protein
MTTIVSAFISNMNTRNDRKLDTYLDLGSLLLKTNIPKIIFIDNEIYDIIKHYENENTKIILFNKQDIYLYQYLNSLQDTFSLDTDFPSKDTLDFIFTMCNKTEWIKNAIELNLFNTENFIWVDFGIRHVFKCNDEEFIKKIENLSNKIYNELRVGTIWNLNIDYNLYYNLDIYKKISWYFAGGVFGGNKEELLKFSDETKKMCVKTINERQNLMWEVNIWYLVFKNNNNFIKYSFYKCDHNDSIIDNY